MEILQGFVDAVVGIFNSSGLTTLNWQNYVMIGISIVLLYLAIKSNMSRSCFFLSLLVCFL